MGGAPGTQDFILCGAANGSVMFNVISGRVGVLGDVTNVTFFIIIIITATNLAAYTLSTIAASTYQQKLRKMETQTCKHVISLRLGLPRLT